MKMPGLPILSTLKSRFQMSSAFSLHHLRGAAISKLTSSVSIIALVVATGMSIPRDANAQSLIDALVSTYLNNPSLLSERASLRSSDEAVPQALSNWRPDVSVDASAGRSIIDNSLSTPNRHLRTPVTVGISATQYLFRGGRTMADTSYAEETVLAARADLLAAEQDILLEAITAYANVYRDKAVLNLNQNNEQVLKRQLEATRDRFEVGEITRTDVHQAEARLADATADKIQSEGDYQVSRATFQNVVGEVASDDLVAPEIPKLGVDGKDELIKFALEHNPDVVSARFTSKASKDNIDKVWGELLPTVDVTASHTRKFQSSSGQGRLDTSSVTLNLNVPIYQQGAVYSRLREAKQDAAKARSDVDTAQRTAAEQAARSWEKVLTARARVDALGTAINASVVALEGVEREAAVGSRTVLDVLDAEQELLDSRVTMLRAERDEIVVMYELLASIGKLTARDLELPVELYDPTAHYKEVREMWFGGKSQGGLD